jgi:hypothetical protein
MPSVDIWAEASMASSGHPCRWRMPATLDDAAFILAESNLGGWSFANGLATFIQSDITDLHYQTKRLQRRNL